MRYLVGLLAIVIGAGFTFGTTYTVDDDGPADFNSIQDAIDYVSNGDTVEVQPGIYEEQLNLYGKEITLKSTDLDNPSATQIIANTVEDVSIITFDSGENSSTILSGFKISNIQVHSATAIKCFYSSPCLSNIEIENVKIGISGTSSAPTIINAYIHNLPGSLNDHYDGIAIKSCDGKIDSCVIKNNDFGIRYCNGPISNCIVTNNGWGGGIDNCGGIINNCTISNNRQGVNNSSASIKNCIIVNNSEYGLYNCVGSFQYNNIWNNQLGSYGGGTIPSATDIHLNPQFVDENEYRLKSQIGHWDTLSQTWIADDITSPCIDAGNPSDGINHEPNPNGGRINLGAYGGTLYASLSPNGDGPAPQPLCSNPIQGDINGDCKVDLLDFIILASNWLTCNLEPVSACW